jgi:hypothetical protein
MKLTRLLFCAELALAVSLGSRPSVEKRQIAGILGALASGDTGILGALGSMYISWVAQSVGTNRL